VVGGVNVFTLYAADRTGVRQCVVDPYTHAEIIARESDVSTWTIDLPTDTAAGAVFTADPFARLEVAVDNAAWRSGPMTRLERIVDETGDRLVVSGVDDTVWLARRLAHPQPATPAPPYNTSAYDTHTGPPAQVIADLINVNAGPGAVASRRVPGLSVPPPGIAGPNVTVAARWQNLLTLCQGVARGNGLTFDVVDLALRVRVPVDRGAVFSAGLETLAAWTATETAPTANKVVVAGGGEGTARLIREVVDATSIATWGLVEAFGDRRDTTDPAQMDQAGADALAQGVTPTTVVFTPLDTPGQAFGVDWVLGDLVTVVAGGLTVHDLVREVHVTLDTHGATIVPAVGTPAGDLALFRAVGGLDRRVRQLERV
jgi:hypothetical protein